MKDYISLIIAAAGSGSRMKAGKNKVLLDLCGKLVIERTLEAFLKIEEIRELIIVAREDELEDLKVIAENYDFWALKLVAGGESRQDSINNGLSQVSEDSSYVIVHDAARPFIKEEHIRGAISMAKDYGASAIGVRVKDTLKRVDHGNMIKETIDRSCVWQVQTPQIFEKDLLKRAYENASLKNLSGTDDCSLLEYMDEKIYMYEGDYTNIKLTTVEDMSYGEFLLRKEVGDE